MEPIRTSYANVTLKGEGCLDLPATVAQYQDGDMLQYETAWKPSPEELQDLQEGGTLYLYTLARKGSGFPPTMLSTRSWIEGTPEHEAEDARAERRGQPLTLEELEQMDGEPVWVIYGGYAPHCCVMDVAASPAGAPSVRAALIPGMSHDFYPLETYGKEWTAYRYKPVGGADND